MDRMKTETSPEKPEPTAFASMDYLESEASSRQADITAQESGSGWSPLNCLRLLGRAAGIAGGGDSPVLTEFRGYGIVTACRDGGYVAHITHHQGKTIHLPSHIKRKIDAARFPSPDEAARHARFLILSGTLNSCR
jgi:hypothetical protein